MNFTSFNPVRGTPSSAIINDGKPHEAQPEKIVELHHRRKIPLHHVLNGDTTDDDDEMDETDYGEPRNSA